MRFMEITAKVRLKNFEHIVDLIEQDGGEVQVANYNGNGKAKPKRKRRAHITDKECAAVRAFAKKNGEMTYTAIGKRFGMSVSAVSRICKGVRK